MAFYQQSLATFIRNKLTVNTKNVLFDVNLYNDIMNDDANVEESVENTYKTEFKRRVPTMITNINGEYIPIPNLNGTNNSLEIIFDLVVDDMTGTERESEFEYVDYDDTLLAIDEFKNTLLANYYPLGDSNIMLGGEDSKIEMTYSTPFNMETIRLTFTPLDNDEETILSDNELTNIGNLEKNATHIRFYNEESNVIAIEYDENIEIDLVIYKDGTRWYITDGTNTDSNVSSQVIPYNTITLGYDTGLNAKIKSLSVSSENYLSTELEEISISDFDNKNIITNNGSVSTGIIATNCILFGSDGNAVFQVYPLAVIGQYSAENGVNYHQFSLQLEAMIGDNFIFGNNFEYYIDNTRVYPVDRNHTFALDTQGRQGINDNVMEFIGSESSLDWSQSFFYQPTKKLTSLVKKITTGDVEQNTIYTIRVQYPFWVKEYDVVIEGGGINTDINSITTFTLQFKLASDILTL